MDMAPAKPERPAGLTQRAQTLLDLGRPQEAVTVLLQSLAQSPGDYQALCLLSQAHGNAGNLSEAERRAGQAIEAAPDQEWGHRLLAIHLLAQGGPNTALPAAEEAARLRPDSPKALSTLARAQRLCGKRGEAQQTAERLRQLAPDAFLSHEALALVAIGAQRWREAETHARRALALDPNESTALNNLGVALSHQTDALEWSVSPGRFAEAIDCLFQAITQGPLSDVARRNLRRTLGRYLLISAQFLSWLAGLGLLIVAALGLWAGPAPPECYGLLLVVGATVVPFAVRLSTLARRRFAALPPPVQDFWRRRHHS